MVTFTKSQLACHDMNIRNEYRRCFKGLPGIEHAEPTSQAVPGKAAGGTRGCADADRYRTWRASDASAEAADVAFRPSATILMSTATASFGGLADLQ